jgi:transcriptional regulator GlxA family with amidase domain
LQVTFLEHCGCTPLEFVSRQRLARVRELLAGGRPSTTVTQAALAAGFSHPGKLAQRYYRQYGERPVDTLRRALARRKDRTA